MRWRFALAALLLGCAFSVGTAQAQTDDPAQSDEPAGFSLDELDELDALLEQDSEEASVPLTRTEVVDLVGLALVLGFAMVSFFTKSERLKLGALVLSVGYLGFYKANLVSVVNIYSLLTGNLPEFRIGMTWYALAAFTVVTTVLWGRIYCGRICAFGALTQLMAAVVPSKFRYELPPSIDEWAVKAKYVILAALLVYFLASRNVLVYRYVEPFWMFTLNGNVIMWSLLAILLVATVFVRNLYCRYLCSLGAALGVISNLTVFRIKRWQECRTCKICEKACEWGAIQGPKIIASECVRCDDCERIYADEKRCVHWIVERKKQANSMAV
jgi:NosR/NirI family nitrous oxide reductase transcriptional regulator